MSSRVEEASFLSATSVRVKSAECMMHIMMIRCEKCRDIFKVRKPKSILISQVIPLLKCPKCYPQQNSDICGGCRLPMSIIGKHSNELCESCSVGKFRYKNR